jgi:Bacterial PH domain
MSQEQRFRSAVGWSFKIPALVVGVGLIASQSEGINPVSLVAISLSLAFMRWLYVSTVYTVTERGLRVQAGPLNRWAEAAQLERVRPTTTVLSAPALSLDRLEITGTFGSLVVSPQDRAGFIRALKRIAPQLRLEGGLDSLTAG